MKKAESKTKTPASQRINQQIADLTDWRGKKLAQLRRIILQADPDLAEEWKWDTAGWSHNGMVCSAAAFKDHVKLNFFKGASLKDPKHLFNAGLGAKSTRAIDFGEDDEIDMTALKDLIRSAVALNVSSGKK